MANEDMQKLNEAVREVLKRSVVDQEFRKLAATDGKAALAKVKPGLATSFKIDFVDNFGRDTKIIALPDPISEAHLLSEEELEQVAGGSCEATSCGTSKVAEQL